MGAPTRNLQQSIEVINGSPRYVATVSISGTVATQAVLKNTTYLIWVDTDAYIHGCTAADGTITKYDGTTTALTTANGVPIQASEKYCITMRGDEGWLGVIGSAGNLRIFILELQPYS